MAVPESKGYAKGDNGEIAQGVPAYTRMREYELAIGRNPTLPPCFRLHLLELLDYTDRKCRSKGSLQRGKIHRLSGACSYVVFLCSERNWKALRSEKILSDPGVRERGRPTLCRTCGNWASFLQTNLANYDDIAEVSVFAELNQLPDWLERGIRSISNGENDEWFGIPDPSVPESEWLSRFPRPSMNLEDMMSPRERRKR